jgi:myosin-light-chain kinase
MICGTPNYMSPELLKMKGGDKREGFYPKPVDIWAFGILMFYCLTKKFPFNAMNEPDLLLKIAQGEVDY